MSNDSIGKVFLVATALCVVCAVVVSYAAVELRPLQTKNQELDVKKNILQAAGLMKKGEQVDVDGLFSANIEAKLVDLSTGSYVTDKSATEFNQVKAAKDPAQSIALAPGDDLAGIKRRSKIAPIYLVRKGDSFSRVILPVHGKGLWSTMYGFVALDHDLKTIKNLAFYSHGETPGLGGEVDNPKWQALWDGKKVYGDNGDIAINVIKGTVDANTPGKDNKVDGLSGATITSRGVGHLMQFWLGKQGFGPYLQQLASQGA